MKYIDALKLHDGDEVTVKKTGKVVTIDLVERENNRDDMEVWLWCDDGEVYLHREVR